MANENKDPAAVWPLEEDFQIIEDLEEEDDIFEEGLYDEDEGSDFDDLPPSDEEIKASQDPNKPPAKWRFPS